MISVNVHIQPDLERLVKAFSFVPDKMRAELNATIKQSIFLLLRIARPLVPVDQGYLRGPAMQTEFSDLKGALVNRAPYAIFVHEGTRPHFPPLAAIEGWADRHGIPPYLVARSIASKGTKRHPFFDDAAKEGEGQIQKFFDSALEKIIKGIII